jgi:hypothetical protein
MHPVSPEELMAFLDGELPSDRAEFLSHHFEDCAACKEAVGSQRAFSTSLTSWTVPEASANSQFESRVLEAARSAKSRPSLPGLLQFGSFFRRHWLLTAVSSALATGIVLVISGALLPRPMASRAVKLVEQEPTMYVDLDKAKTLASTDERSKVFTNQIPSTAADSNGLTHGLGDHAQNSVTINGQPISDQQSKGALGALVTEPMIARTVSLSIIAKNFDHARSSLDTILARHNGYTASLNVNTPQGAGRSLEGSLRIPAPQLAAALVELKSLGHVENETQNGEEVTQQHADLIARLKNSRETEQRLQAILQQRTGKISDVLAVEQEIARVRGEIEQMEAEQRNLEHRVDFASIDLKLSEEYKAQLESPAPSASLQLHNASVNGYRNVVDTLFAALLFFAEYGPVLLLWAFILFIPAWLFWRRYRRAAAAA